MIPWKVNRKNRYTAM